MRILLSNNSRSYRLSLLTSCECLALSFRVDVRKQRHGAQSACTMPRVLCRLKLVLDGCDASSAAVQAALVYTVPGFAPGLPGLTKLVSKFTQEGAWQKALSIFHGIGVLGTRVRMLVHACSLKARCDFWRQLLISTRSRALFCLRPALCHIYTKK